MAKATAGGTLDKRHRAAAMWAVCQPENAEAIGTLAGSYQQSGRNQLALAAGRRALALDPSLVWVRANLAVVLRE
ncbi:MAG: hypothetical protein NXI18_10720 [Alphaproteobacteria bacterium]|nr:hypothetical protein [Alphaproteobacteria bacterium]